MENAQKTNVLDNKLYNGFTDSYYPIFTFSELNTFYFFLVFDFETWKMPREQVFWIISCTRATLIPVRPFLVKLGQLFGFLKANTDPAEALRLLWVSVK